MLELKDPSAARVAPSFTAHKPDNVSNKSMQKMNSMAHKPQLNKIKSCPKATRKIDKSKPNWWIHELEIFRKTVETRSTLQVMYKQPMPVFYVDATEFITLHLVMIQRKTYLLHGTVDLIYTLHTHTLIYILVCTDVLQH
jgi:hypothetical protein